MVTLAHRRTLRVSLECADSRVAQQTRADARVYNPTQARPATQGRRKALREQRQNQLESFRTHSSKRGSLRAHSSRGRGERVDSGGENEERTTATVSETGVGEVG
ncbi:hypothetical protein GCM10025298_19140 [Natronobiforma cellulositropha]